MAIIIDNSEYGMLRDFLKFSFYYHIDVSDLDMDSVESRLDFLSYFFYEYMDYCPDKKKDEINRKKLENEYCEEKDFAALSAAARNKNKDEFQIEIEDSGNGPTVYTINNKYRKRLEEIVSALDLDKAVLWGFDYYSWQDEVESSHREADKESRDPYGYRGLSRSDFY